MNTTDKTERELEEREKLCREKVDAIESALAYEMKSIDGRNRDLKELYKQLDAIHQQKSELAQLREQKQGEWKPEEGETYNWIGGCGEIILRVYGEHHSYARNLVQIGNCFKPGTGEAERVAENFRNHLNLLKLDARQLDKIAVQVKVAEMARESKGEPASNHGFIPRLEEGKLEFVFMKFNYGLPSFRNSYDGHTAFASLSGKEIEDYFYNY
jgi:hypothetical protein